MYPDIDFNTPLDDDQFVDDVTDDVAEIEETEEILRERVGSEGELMEWLAQIREY